MQIIPAIDIKDGHCVRLKQGDMQAATVFSEDPAAIARHWLELGAQRLHLVDLNGAVAGKPSGVKLPSALSSAVCKLEATAGSSFNSGTVVRSTC